MPLQLPYVSDQVPALTLAGAQGLGSGIGGGIKSIGDAIEKHIEETRRINSAGQAAKKFLNEVGKQSGADPNRINALSARDAISEMTGMIGAQHYQAGIADAQDKIERGLALKAAREGAARQPEFAAEIAKYAQPGQLPQNLQPEDYGLPEGQDQPGTREFMAAAARIKYPLKLSELDDLERAMQGRREQAAFFKPEQFGTATPITTKEGKALPGLYNTVLGPRASQVVTDATSGLIAATDEQGNEIPGVFVTAKGNPFQLRPEPAKRGAITALDQYRALGQEINALAIYDGMKETKDNKPMKDRLAALRAKRDRLEKAAAGGSEESEGDVLMFDRQNNKVRVPRARLGEFKGKGYQLAQ